MKKSLFNILLFLLFIPFPDELFAQANKTQLIAAYINNFAKYVHFPDEAQIDSFRIAIISKDITFKNEVLEFAKKYKIKEKPVALSFHLSLPLPQNIQMLFIDQDVSANFLDIYDAIEGKPILLISYNYPDKRIIMINLFENQNEQMLFEVNRANIINQKLEIDPEILLLGGAEIDVARLYRNSLSSVREYQKNMDKMNDSIRALNKYIQAWLELISQKQTELSEQKKLIDDRNEEFNNLQNVIGFQSRILAAQKDSIRNKNLILQKQQNETKKQLLLASQLDIKNLQNEEALRKKLELIEQMNRDIALKNRELGTQTDTIQRQNQMIAMLITIAFLIAILIITIFIAYRNNKHKTNILTEQTKEIEDKLDELKQLNLQLQTVDQYKSIFLASMSHELRTPLNSIIGYTGILLMGMTGELNTEQNTQLTKVKNNAKHLLSLINDILDISKIEANKVELQLEEFNINEVINEVVEMVFPKASEKKLEVSADIPNDFTLYSDKRRIKQVVLNLAINAVNYSDSGKILISIQPLEDEHLQISVKDNGIGISESNMARLFQPFQQIDYSLTKQNKGTGLGLYLCRKIITMLGGTIYAKSEEGKGSEFFIEIPVKLNSN